MLIDVNVVNKISLNINPEEYQIYYTIQTEDVPYMTQLQKLLGERLTIKADPKKPLFYQTSIFDFTILKRRLKEANINAIFNFTPRASEVYKKYLEQLLLLKKIKNGFYNDRIKSTLKTTPFPDQYSAAAFLLTRNKAANCCSVGIGKSLSALLCFNILKNDKMVSNGIIFCLNQNKDGWERQIKQHTDYTYRICRNGTELVENDIYDFKEDLLVVHHNAIIKEPVRQAIINRNFTFHIFDEAHTLRNLDSQQSMSYFDIYDKSKPKWFIPLTGTPIPEKPMNAYSILKLMSPENIPTKSKFENHFCNFIHIPKQIRKGNRFFKIKIPILNKSKPYKNLDELKEYMEMFTYRKTHETVEGFPPTLISVKPIELSRDAKIIYNKLVDESYKQIAAHPSQMVNLHDIMTKTLRLRQFLSNPALIGETNVTADKFDFLDELLEEIMDDSSQKVIVFSSFVDTLRLMQKKYDKKYGALLYKGVDKDFSKDMRSYNEKAFLENSENRLLCMNTGVAVGVDFYNCRNAIYLDLPVPRLQWEQSLGRITRRSSKGTSNIIILSGKNTYDEVLKAQHEGKNEIIDSLVGKDREVTEIQAISKEELLKGLKRLDIK